MRPNWSRPDVGLEDSKGACRLTGILLAGLLGGLTFSWFTLRFATPASAGPRSVTPVRGAYFYASVPLDHLDELKAAGFSTGAMKVTESDPSPGVLANVAAKRARADSLGIDLFITFNFHNRQLLAQRAVPERRFKDRLGVVHPQIPCPADTAYWCGLLHDWVLPVAQVAGHPARIAFDLELYDVGVSHYPAGPCTCTPCRLDYTGYTGPNREFAESWIERLPLGDLEDLERAEREWVASVLAEELQAIEQLSGGLELVVLDLGRPGLPGRSLLLATTRLGLPVLDFTELTYVEGSSVPSEQLRVTYANHPPGAVGTVDGLWLLKWSPEQLEDEAVLLARRDAGYWIFTSVSLALPPERLFGAYALQAPREEYWQALTRANARLITGN